MSIVALRRDPRLKECKFFAAGKCLLGSACRFVHISCCGQPVPMIHLLRARRPRPRLGLYTSCF
jgi:hypothetical protein